MRKLTRLEDGVAMVVVLGLLLVSSTLAATLLASAMADSSSTTRGASLDRALAAADAGLSAARYRLSSTGATSAQCFTTAGVAPAGGAWPSPGACPAVAGSTGDGGSYQYEVSPSLSSTDSCAGTYVQATAGIDQRCITAIGTVNGASRRVQQRVVAYTVSHTFPANGWFATNGISSSGTATINGDIASNGNIKSSGTFSLTGHIDTVPGTTYTGACAAPACTVVPQPTAYPVPAPDPTALANARASNNDAAIAWPSGIWTPSTFMLDASIAVGSSGSPIIIPSGVYYFCRFAFHNPTYLALAPGARVVIYVDSDKRAGSGCPSSTGDVSITGNLSWVNPSHDPTALQIYAYGDPSTQKGTLKFNNALDGSSAPFYALINAPNSLFTTTNVASLAGGVVAGTITTSNTVTVTGAVGSALQSSATPVFYPTGWRECASATPTGSDISTGC